MKSGSKAVLLSAIVLASPLFSFAGSQHLVRVPTKEEAQDRSGITPAVQSGKGTGSVRSQGVQANAYRTQTPAESQVAKQKPAAAQPNWADPAYRK